MSGGLLYKNGQGAQINPRNRFFSQGKGEDFDDIDPSEEIQLKTRFIEVHPKTIVNKPTSPDVGMCYSLNPYQGCEHGCTYCYARPTHEYWGYSAGVDFERVILVKKNAPELLEETLKRKSWRVRTISVSGNTDCYQPCERQYQITRRLLKIMLKYRHPVGIITKNALITRDLDILEELAALNLVQVNISMTSLKEELRRKLEPRTASSRKKLEAIELLAQRKIPVNVMMAPIIPALNDDEIFSVAKEVGSRGALSMYHQIVRLSGPNREIFTDWVNKNYPDRAGKVLNQLRDMHGGQLNDSRFGTRMKGEGVYALNIQRQVQLARKRFLPDLPFPRLRTDLFTVPGSSRQMELF
ncbi:PA0069 family radical SAM protein [Fluviicola sp.]|jgi:DNA repair photolyase|uniref:PA0069 family radical SAM protein n=1 Tax=Fluviicola sp. TaxID=1917219 RepID=UPI002838488E|nr:PA0069 family radical SAM protein [Fluviicola sp.]MDR0801218.1 PA0069 family radical SAM protein [Fluviicola sp.]